MLINNAVRAVFAPLNIMREAVKMPASVKLPKNLIKRGPSSMINPLEKLIKLVGITNNRSVFVSGSKEGSGENLLLCLDIINVVKNSEKRGASKIHTPAKRRSFATKKKRIIRKSNSVEYSTIIEMALSFNSLNPWRTPLRKKSKK
ncbi:unnamed protein product [marine sediment metagenome]|uniref:Uncharacterized protein n=1 Tax=marine sediment metagenome TaxID=412755 RepID=X1FP31_9ZZZZ